MDTIYALLDDLEHFSSQGLNRRQTFSLHLDIAIATERDSRAAEQYGRLDQAMRQVESAYSDYRTTQTAVTDTLTAEAHSDLGHAISNAKDAFKRLATQRGSDPALLDEIGRLLSAIGRIRGDLYNLRDMHVTAAFPDRPYRRVPVAGVRPRLRRAVSDEPHEIVHEDLRRLADRNPRGPGRFVNR